MPGVEICPAIFLKEAKISTLLKDVLEEILEEILKANNKENIKELEFVISLNLHRRHLNETQRAVIASKIANMPAHRPENNSANLPTYSQPEAAEMLNISERTLRSKGKRRIGSVKESGVWKC